MISTLKDKGKITLSGKALREYAKLNYDTGYKKGFEDGNEKCLKHNMNLMKMQSKFWSKKK